MIGKFVQFLQVVTVFGALYSVEPKRSKYFIAIKKTEDHFPQNLIDPIVFNAPLNRFYADPMLFKYRGINYLFFEDYDYKKGVISYCTVDQEGRVSSPQKVLELPIHLSFPHVFQEEEEIYMTPETYDYRSVSLFKATEFPTKWEKQRVLVEGEDFADPILFKHNGYYWLFAAAQYDRLRIYYAENLNSPFLPHPVNRENRAGRNAGSVFFVKNRLIRPTMDCSRVYGGSMILKQIVTLDPEHFVEKSVVFIAPDWAPLLDGTHTYCQNEDWIVYDGRRTIFQREDHLYSVD